MLHCFGPVWGNIIGSVQGWAIRFTIFRSGWAKDNGALRGRGVKNLVTQDSNFHTFSPFHFPPSLDYNFPSFLLHFSFFPCFYPHPPPHFFYIFPFSLPLPRTPHCHAGVAKVFSSSEAKF